MFNIEVLKALVYLLPGPPKRKVEHGPYRIMKIIQTMTFADNIMEKVREVAESCEASPFSPFIIIATTNELPVAFYLSVYDAVYKFETFLGAFDMLFKVFFVFQLPYPEELLSVFTFLQVFFYGIKTGNDKTIGNVTKLIKMLDFTRLPN